MSNVNINVDRRTDGRTDGQKIGRLYRTLLQAGAIKIKYEQIMLQWKDGQKNRFLADRYIRSTFQLGDNKI